MLLYLWALKVEIKLVSVLADLCQNVTNSIKKIYKDDPSFWVAKKPPFEARLGCIFGISLLLTTSAHLRQPMLYNLRRSAWVIKISKAVPFAVLGAWLTIAGCEQLPEEAATAQPQGTATEAESKVAVETAIAKTGSLQEVTSYSGTTEPFRQVSLRSQAEGRLLNLSVDVGDVVRQGEVVARLDDRLLNTAVNQAQAQLAALDAEVAQAQAEVSAATAEVEQTKVQLQQLQADAQRFSALWQEGAIAQQQAEQAQTAAAAAAQTLRSAQDQVRTRQQALLAAQRRVIAQKAVVAETQERKGYSQLGAPITGVVLERLTDPGNLVQPGDEVIRLGDFSAVKVMVQVSELDLNKIRVGQPTQVKLDALPAQVFPGEITRISPAADPTSRLVPVEVKIPNPEAKIGSGLLARVQFQPRDMATVVVPESAFRVGGKQNQSTLFVVQGTGDAAKAMARPVQVGKQSNGKVEILSGLQSGEPLILKSARPLADGQAVRLSILSETGS